MKETKNLPVILVLFFLSLLSLIYISEGINFLICITSITISVIIFSIVNTQVGFLFLLAQTLGIGFFNTWVAFYAKASNVNQFSVILQHIVLITCLATLWLVFHTLEKLKTEQREMKNTIAELKKYETAEQILTKSEFFSRAKFILTGMNRRNEKGYLLTLKVNNDKKHVRDSVFHSLAKTTLETIRREYDLAGKHSDDSIMILLQNTTINGCEVVTQRLEKNLGEIFSLENRPYSIEVKEWNDEMYSNFSKEGLSK